MLGGSYVRSYFDVKKISRNPGTRGAKVYNYELRPEKFYVNFSAGFIVQFFAIRAGTQERFVPKMLGHGDRGARMWRARLSFRFRRHNISLTGNRGNGKIPLKVL
jgi:hypothetical protein